MKEHNRFIAIEIGEAEDDYYAYIDDEGNYDVELSAKDEKSLNQLIINHIKKLLQYEDN